MFVTGRARAGSLAWLLACMLFAVVAHADPADLLAPKEGKLKNGLRVLTLEDPKAAVLSFQVWYDVGSRNERPGITGISHLFEHMMFKGSKNVGPEEHARLIQAVGGVENAFTTWDVTVYWETIPPTRSSWWRASRPTACRRSVSRPRIFRASARW